MDIFSIKYKILHISFGFVQITIYLCTEIQILCSGDITKFY